MFKILSPYPAFELLLEQSKERLREGGLCGGRRYNIKDSILQGARRIFLLLFYLDILTAEHKQDVKTALSR